MVVRGYLDYAGQPLNLASDLRYDVLKAVECGAGIQFSWIYQHPEKIKGTKYAALFDVYYQYWFHQALDVYDEVSTALAGLAGQPIINHTKLDSGVYQTEFANGDAVIVNYNDHPVIEDGVWIEALNFRRLHKGVEE